MHEYIACLITAHWRKVLAVDALQLEPGAYVSHMDQRMTDLESQSRWRTSARLATHRFITIRISNNITNAHFYVRRSTLRQGAVVQFRRADMREYTEMEK